MNYEVRLPDKLDTDHSLERASTEPWIKGSFSLFLPNKVETSLVEFLKRSDLSKDRVGTWLLLPPVNIICLR